MSVGITGRVALVTGGGKGIGRAIALQLASAGAAVAVVGRTRDDLDVVAAEIARMGGRSLALTADVTRAGDVESSVETTVAELGSIDILVNNAGQNQLGPIGTMSADDWWAQLDVNLRGPYLYCRAVVPRMAAAGWGRIINIASVAGKTGMPYASAYCSAKHGLIGLTKALAVEVASSGITVNAVCPGFVATDLTKSTMDQRSKLFGVPAAMLTKRAIEASPQKRAVEADDVANAVVFLASSLADRVTGEAMNVSGGAVMH